MSALPMTAVVLGMNPHKSLVPSLDVRGRLLSPRAVIREVARGERADRLEVSLPGPTPDSATRLSSLHDPEALTIRKGLIGWPVELGTRPRSPTRPSTSPSTTTSNTAPHPITPALGAAQPIPGAPGAGGDRLTVAKASRRGTRPARPRLLMVAIPTIEHSRCFWRLVNGIPAAKGGSAIKAATAGTEPAWTVGREPPSGAATASSPTTGQDRVPATMISKP
jgi:hypothetical protein